MSRLNVAPFAGLLFLSLAACGDAGPARANVLLVTVDTLRADHLGAYGDTEVDTPNLDAFLAGAVVFENSWTVVPLTTPSLGSLLTSRTPRNHGAINNSYDLTSRDPTLAMALTEAGYRSGAFLPTFLADKPGFKRGFERYDHPKLGEGHRSGGEVVRRAMEFMSEVENDDDAWFVWVHLIEPHSPYAPGTELEAKYLPEGAQPTEELRAETYGESAFSRPEEVEIVKALYRGDVELADRALAPLLSHAKTSATPILTVFTADHGEMMYEHENYFGHASWLYEPILSVPLAFHRNDGQLKAAVRADPVTQLDVGPTLLGMLGIDWMSRDGGMDLFKATADADRLVIHETFAPESFRDKYAVRRGPWKMQEAETGKWVKGSTSTAFRKIANLKDSPTEDTVSDVQAAGVTFVKLRQSYLEWSKSQPIAATLHKEALDVETRRALEKMGYAQGFLRVNELEYHDPQDG